MLLTRDAEGTVHAIANACRHRGVRVADGCGQARRLTCPFHAWTYDTAGQLVGLPTAAGFDGMRREDKGLVQLPVAEGYGLVVGRLRPGPPVDVDELLGPRLAEELALLDFAAWQPLRRDHTHPVGANWKVTLDTYRENYHFDYLHRDTLKSYAYGGVLTFDAFGPHLRNCSAIRSIDELRELPRGAVARRRPSLQLPVLAVPEHVPDLRQPAHRAVADLPRRGRPVSRAAHRLRPSRAAGRGARQAGGDGAVDLRDRRRRRGLRVAARTEPGIRTGLVDTIVFGRNEPACQHLHRGFREALEAAATA